MKNLLLFLLSIVTISCNAQSSVPTTENQIAAAVMAAPEEMRAGAAVIGYSDSGELTELRKGTNEMVCLADDPSKEGFNVSCYQKDLAPFMARGRELRKAGKTSKEVFDIRESEVEAGTLKMPSQPTTLYVLSGDNGKYDAASGEVKNAFYRYVIYIPYATSASTGLPLQPINPGDPWIMDPGTYRAHIMITPPKPESK